MLLTAELRVPRGGDSSFFVSDRVTIEGNIPHFAYLLLKNVENPVLFAAAEIAAIHFNHPPTRRSVSCKFVIRCEPELALHVL
jgi:hypothetical protein